MFGKTIKCPDCRGRVLVEDNTRYVKCECGKLLPNKHFIEPTFDELEFSKHLNISNWSESVFNIAKEMEKTIQKIEFLGNNEAVIYFTGKVCTSKNETILLSNLTHMKNDITRFAKISFKYAVCADFHKKCDYSHLCPLRSAVFLYLYRKEYGDEAIKEARKLSKIELSKNNTSKEFNWDVNNHSSEYVPTRTLKFVEKLLDNNYISFTYDTSNNNVICTASKSLTFGNLEYLMKLSQKKLREVLTMDLESFSLDVSCVGDSSVFYIQHLAKYVEYLRRNHSYESFYKRQTQKEREFAKAKKVSPMLEKTVFVGNSA